MYAVVVHVGVGGSCVVVSCCVISGVVVGSVCCVVGYTDVYGVVGDVLCYLWLCSCRCGYCCDFYTCTT